MRLHSLITAPIKQLVSDALKKIYNLLWIEQELKESSLPPPPPPPPPQHRPIPSFHLPSWDNIYIELPQKTEEPKEKNRIVNGRLEIEGKTKIPEKMSSSAKRFLVEQVKLHGVDAVAAQTVVYYLLAEQLPAFKSTDKVVLHKLTKSDIARRNQIFAPCDQRLLDFITEKNFFQFWNLAKYYSNDAFLETMMRFAAMHFLALKRTTVKYMTFKELTFLLKHLRIQTTHELEGLLVCLCQWAKENITEKPNIFAELIPIVDIGPLTEEQIEYFLSCKATPKFPPHAIEALIESFTMSHLKFYVISKNSLRHYSLRHETWSESKKIPLLVYEKPVFSFLDKKLYFLAHDLSTSACPGSLYRCNKDDGSSLEFCIRLQNECNNRITAYEGKVFFLKGSFDKPTRCWKNKFYVYDTAMKKIVKTISYTSATYVEGIHAFQNNLYTLERNTLVGIRTCKRYDLDTGKWYNFNVPRTVSAEPSRVYTTICMGCLVLIVLETQVDPKDIFYFEKRRTPSGQMQTLRQRGPAEVFKDENGKIQFRPKFTLKRFFRYDPSSLKWTETKTSGGPMWLKYVWHGPSSYFSRVPYIYVVGDDWYLYQYAPIKDEWTKLCAIPMDSTNMNYKIFTLGV